MNRGGIGCNFGGSDLELSRSIVAGVWTLKAQRWDDGIRLGARKVETTIIKRILNVR